MNLHQLFAQLEKFHDMQLRSSSIHVSVPYILPWYLILTRRSLQLWFQRSFMNYGINWAWWVSINDFFPRIVKCSFSYLIENPEKIVLSSSTMLIWSPSTTTRRSNVRKPILHMIIASSQSAIEATLHQVVHIVRQPLGFFLKKLSSPETWHRKLMVIFKATW